MELLTTKELSKELKVSYNTLRFNAQYFGNYKGIVAKMVKGIWYWEYSVKPRFIKEISYNVYV